MNFGNPERPEIMGQFVGCIAGMKAACEALAYPVVSGNVSLYNETNGQAILPTPVIGGVGLIDDLDRIVAAALPGADETLVLIGETRGHLGASIYLRDIEGVAKGPPPPVDLAAERRNGDFVRAQIQAGGVSACHDLSDGGLAVALAEMALAGDCGADISEGANSPDNPPLAAWLFGEDQARYLVTTGAAPALLAAAERAGVPARAIGRTGGNSLILAEGEAISLAELRAGHEGWLPNYMAR
jgi:phosphoribosylformylglycinamidine synthase